MIDKKTSKFIKETISHYLDPQEYDVFIFGSRAENTNKKYSDIDIGIKGKKPIGFKTIAKLQDIFEESDLPFIVDIVDFQQVSDTFKSVAEKHIIPL